MLLLEPYQTTLILTTFMLGWSLLLLAITDIISIKSKHPPGYPVKADHKDLLFRSNRAHANTNETLTVFIALVVLAVIAGASASYINLFVGIYVAARVAHSVCYFANWSLPRSLAFGVSFIGLIGLLVNTLIAVL